MLGDLGKLIVAKALKTCPKSKKLPDLVTLLPTYLPTTWHAQKVITFIVELSCYLLGKGKYVIHRANRKVTKHHNLF